MSLLEDERDLISRIAQLSYEPETRTELMQNLFGATDVFLDYQNARLKYTLHQQQLDQELPGPEYEPDKRIALDGYLDELRRALGACQRAAITYNRVAALVDAKPFADYDVTDRRNLRRLEERVVAYGNEVFEQAMNKQELPDREHAREQMVRADTAYVLEAQQERARRDELLRELDPEYFKAKEEHDPGFFDRHAQAYADHVAARLAQSRDDALGIRRTPYVPSQDRQDDAQPQM